MRSDAGTSFKSLGNVNNGEVFDYLGEKTGTDNMVWYNISGIIGGKQQSGYIRSDYAKYVEETIETPSPADIYRFEQKEGKTYCYKNDQLLKGYADINGLRYYFNTQTGAKESYTCIDVSRYQKNINWASVKAAGIEYAIIRVGFRGYETGRLSIDPYFEQNIIGAKAAGIKCGVYFYSVANDAVDSNGRIDIDGGSLVADGSFSPEQGGDVDDPSAFAMSGGTLLSVGGSMGPYPVLPLDAGTSVPVVAWSGVDAPKNSFVSLASSDGKLLLGYRLPRALERGAVLFASDNLMSDAENTLALSAGIDSDGYVGNGLYRGGHATDVNDSVTFRLQGLINGVSANGEVTVIEPGKEFPRGMMPPPPPHAVDSAVHGGAFPPPMPPGGSPQGMAPPPPPHADDTVGGRGAFPPPPPHVRKVKSEYGLGNLPIND